MCDGVVVVDVSEEGDRIEVQYPLCHVVDGDIII